MAHPKKRTCAAMEHLNHLAAVDEVYRENRRSLERFTQAARLARRTTVVKIPVVVHVIYNNDSENLSTEQVESQIAALNRDYRARNNPELIPAPFRALAADPLIEFALALRDPSGKATTGITRKQTTQSSFPYDSFDPQATAKLDRLVKTDEYGHAPWPAESYLNLWACTLDGGLLGYAQFPGGRPETDGVVILNTAFGTTGTAAEPNNAFNQGRTAVHEVGHWLNLLHIWGDDDNGCTGSDNVGDTPNQAGSNSGKPSFPSVTCGNEPNGDMFMNYMDYVDDEAMFMFTKGQVSRFDATLAGPRKALLSSPALTPVSASRLVLDTPADAKGESTDSRKVARDAGQRWFDGVSWVEG